MKVKDQKEINSNNNDVSEGEKKNTNMLVAAFMIFIIPIVLVFIGVLIGSYIGKYIGCSVKISEIVGGIVGFAVSAIAIKLFDKSSKADENAEKIHWDDL